MNRAKLIIALVVCAFAWCSWLFRYDLRPVSSTFPSAYLLDRWTWNTYFSRVGGGWEKIEFEKKTETENVSMPKAAGVPQATAPPAGEAPPKVVTEWDEGAPVKK